MAWRDAKWLSLFLLLLTPASSGAIKDPAADMGGAHYVATAAWRGNVNSDGVGVNICDS